MSKVTIDLRTHIKITIDDSAGVPHDYDLVEGINEVPPEVAEHWYVSKFTRPVRRVPRGVIASPQMSAALLAKAAEVSQSIVQATNDNEKPKTAPGKPDPSKADARPT